MKPNTCPTCAAPVEPGALRCTEAGWRCPRCITSGANDIAHAVRIELRRRREAEMRAAMEYIP